MVSRRKSVRTGAGILIVDDSLEDAQSKQGLFRGRLSTVAKTPDDVTVEDLKSADLVLIDFVLDGWLEQLAITTIANIPRDGRALAAVLRSQCDPMWPPTAFALHSARLNQLAGVFPSRPRPHVIARTNNLEWAFSKLAAENSQPFEEQVIQLAAAVAELPRSWPAGDEKRMRRTVGQLLGLEPKADWADRAWRTIDDCHPPLHEFSTATHGLAFLRWLLHQVLPFPTFLWDTRQLAARLRVTPHSLRAALNDDQKVRRALRPFRYAGVLSSFLGDRWWRSGIEGFLWQKTAAKSFAPDALRDFVVRLSASLTLLDVAQPVVVFDEYLQASDVLIDVSEAVQLMPDDWPPFADPAWASKSDVTDDEGLRSLAVRRDDAEA
jgi:hypothetical protein